jgi:hypothetical protein
MPALNFQKQFAAKIERGLKRCTIRAPRQRAIRAGDPLHLFTGMRTKACRKLKTAPCLQAVPIQIAQGPKGESCIIEVDNRALNKRAALILARQDGHTTLEHFAAFFEATHGLPFHGVLIVW